MITKTLEEKLDDEERTEEQKCEVFKQILEDLNYYNDETNTGNSNQPKEDSTQKHGDTATVGGHNQTSRGNGNLSPLLPELNQRTSLLRKELKIKGQIGEAHQKDKLTYVSLIHQINEAQEAGYDESEIVNSVIRAMSPSLTLRNVLETTSNLSLQRLLQFLESHFEEKSATDLCGKLTSMIQLPEETEYSYVMKCIEVRQKVLLASSKSDIKYDKGLVMKLFYRNLERSLLSSYVVQEIKPLLRSSVSDEDLITAVSKGAASEKERNLALGKKKQVKVYEVGSARPSNSPGNSDNKVDKLLAAVELLTKQVSTLQSEINNIKGDGYKTNVSDDFNSGDRRGRNVILCKNCKDNNRTTCNHCFKCGSSNHLARGCRNPSSGNQGN